MKVWIIEERHPATSCFDSVVAGVRLSKEEAVKSAMNNLDALEGERGWYFISKEDTDEELWDGELEQAIFIDRKGNISNTRQPCNPPFLIAEEDQISLTDLLD